MTFQLVDSTTGPSCNLVHSLWLSDETSSQVTVLWQDTNMLPWEPEQAYRWSLIHRPSTGLIR